MPTCWMERPPLTSVSSRLMSVRMKTIRSPFLPEMRAQSSGFVVLGRSSFSRYSWRIDCDQVVGAKAATLVGDLALDRQLLRASHDVLDHRARREVLEVQDLLVAALVGDLEEAVLVVDAVHVGDGLFDHDLDRLVAVSPAEVANRSPRRSAVRACR